MATLRKNLKPLNVIPLSPSHEACENMTEVTPTSRVEQIANDQGFYTFAELCTFDLIIRNSLCVYIIYNTTYVYNVSIHCLYHGLAGCCFPFSGLAHKFCEA